MIRPFGESALFVSTGTPARAQSLARALVGAEGIAATIPGLGSLLVELELDADRAAAEATLASLLEETPPDPTPDGTLHEIPVRYGASDGPDLAAVADATGLTEAEVVDRHAATEVRVLFCGFAPGFAYLGDLPESLRVPRLATPRTRTPAGSVAIAGPMTGIYPADLPGGWRVIGRTDVGLFDPRREPPARLLPGDRVRFVPDR